MERPRLRRGIWWFRNPNGTWMRWESPAGQWRKAPTPPPPPFPCKDVEAHGHASVEDYFTADLELFKSVVAQQRFVTKMFWEQATFFLVIQSALLTVVAQSLPKGEGHPAQPWPLLVLSFLGLVLALFWAWVALNRVWIIAQWRDKVRYLDTKVDRHHVYEDVEAVLERFWYRKPTSVTMFLPLFLAVCWLGLLILGFVLLIIQKS